MRIQDDRHEEVDRRSPPGFGSDRRGSRLGCRDSLFISWGNPVEPVLFNAVLWAVLLGASWHFDARRQRKTAAKLDAQGGMLVYVRYPDTRPGSLSGIWNMGVASPESLRTILDMATGTRAVPGSVTAWAAMTLPDGLPGIELGRHIPPGDSAQVPVDDALDHPTVVSETTTRRPAEDGSKGWMRAH